MALLGFDCDRRLGHVGGAVPKPRSDLAEPRTAVSMFIAGTPGGAHADVLAACIFRGDASFRADPRWPLSAVDFDARDRDRQLAAHRPILANLLSDAAFCGCEGPARCCVA